MMVSWYLAVGLLSLIVVIGLPAVIHETVKGKRQDREEYAAKMAARQAAEDARNSRGGRFV